MRKRTHSARKRRPGARQTIAAASRNSKVTKSSTSSDDQTSEDADEADGENDQTSQSKSAAGKSSSQTQMANSQMANSGNGKGQSSDEQLDAIEFLKNDHRKVEKLFADFKASQDDKKKRDLVKQVCNALAVHTQIEEEIFYPACRQHVKEEDLNRAQVEHDAAKLLIQDLLQGGGRGDKYLDAKVHLLAEEIRQHVEEEERGYGSIFEQARRDKVDLDKLGQQLVRRSQQLTEEYGNGEAEVTRIVSIRTQLQSRSGQSRRNEGGMSMATRDMTRNQGSYMEDEEFGGEGRFPSRESGSRYGERGYGSQSGYDQNYGRSGQSSRQSNRDNDRDYMSQQNYGYRGSQSGQFGSRGYGSESDFGARGNQGMHADADYGSQGYDQDYNQSEGGYRNQSYGQASGNYRQNFGERGSRYQNRSGYGGQDYGSSSNYGQGGYGRDNDDYRSTSSRSYGQSGRDNDEYGYGGQYQGRNRSNQYSRDNDMNYGGSSYGRGGSNYGQGSSYGEGGGAYGRSGQSGYGQSGSSYGQSRGGQGGYGQGGYQGGSSSSRNWRDDVMDQDEDQSDRYQPSGDRYRNNW